VKATELEIQHLEGLYEGRKPFFGDLHNHAQTSDRSDGLRPLSHWKGALEALKLAVVGAVVFTLVTWLYSTIQDRLSSGPAAKLAPIFSALGLYLAFQAFAGMIL
jgi:hypothetical protein